MKKPYSNHLELLCDVGELTARLAGSADIRGFSQQMVEMIAKHLKSDVCSIYLYDEQLGEVVLFATVGLASESVGQVRMALGEGLTGLVMKELRPIREDHASKNPSFKSFPGINEETFESFLAVPILKGLERIGVLVVQRQERNFFTDRDVMALQATAAQLAGSFENIRMIVELQKAATVPTPQPVSKPLTLVTGRSASAGMAYGPAVVLDSSRRKGLSENRVFSSSYTLDDFRRSLDKTAQQLRQLQEQVGRKLAEIASMIFDAHLMMLKDETFIGEIVSQIENGQNPPEAVLHVGRKYASLLQSSPHAYIREKAHDVEDLVDRIIANLTGDSAEIPMADHPQILVARELFPSDILKFASSSVQGVVLVSGGVTSHVAILARSLRLPMIIADKLELLQLKQGTPVLLDARAGNLHIDPAEDVVETFRQQDKARQEIETQAVDVQEQTCTVDGHRVTLLANINLLNDLELAQMVKSEGVGLYRSEFPFLVRGAVPSQTEQAAVYRRLVRQAPKGKVTFRTLDIGGDKLLAYYDEEGEANPTMGLRSIRFTLRHREVFRSQLKAILRAGAKVKSLRIMFPMVTSVEDFTQARQVVYECMEELKQSQQEYHKAPSLGIMVEVPSAVAMIDALAEEAEFFCIGTNDLIQFLLAVDRGNQKVESYYVPHHPAVLRALNRVTEVGLRTGREVSVCGEMASEPKYLPFLLGIGIRVLSVDPQYIPKLQKFISKLRMDDCERHAQEALAQRRLEAVDRIMTIQASTTGV